MGANLTTRVKLAKAWQTLWRFMVRTSDLHGSGLDGDLLAFVLVMVVGGFENKPPHCCSFVANWKRHCFDDLIIGSERICERT
jgi:hypothetical protein